MKRRVLLHISRSLDPENLNSASIKRNQLKMAVGIIDQS